MTTSSPPPRTRLGIVGVGEIGSAIVDGLCNGIEPADTPVICLSPRGASTAQRLAEQYSTVMVGADNQAVADHADVLVIAVRPESMREAMSKARVRPGTVVISVVAGVDHDELRGLLGADVDLVRAIPLPAVRHRTSLTATYPAHPVATDLFNRLGRVLELSDDQAFSALSAATGTISTQLAFLSAISAWIAQQGIAPVAADRYVRSLFVGLGEGLADPTQTLDELVAAHETPGGLNNQLRTAWFNPEVSALHAQLDALLGRIGHPQARRT